MKYATLALLLSAGLGTGCALLPDAGPVAVSALPNCFESNYDRQRDLFTLNAAAGGATNQQCLLTVRPAGTGASAKQLSAGRYMVYFADGGGGGAGGTMQGMSGGGGGGGGGAGALESRVQVALTPGLYRLTIGAGGPGGNACSERPFVFGGGPGWAGSPTSMVQLDTGRLIAGVRAADSYARPKRAQNEKSAGKVDGHGGSGPGQTDGGHGSIAPTPTSAGIAATAGQDRRGGGTGGAAGVLPANKTRPGDGGGGGATILSDGGDGGGEVARHRAEAPERGALGSGGGGGVGNDHGCAPGARGGHGYIALRAI